MGSCGNLLVAGYLLERAGICAVCTVARAVGVGKSTISSHFAQVVCLMI